MGFGRSPRGSPLFPERNKFPQIDLEEIKAFIDQGSVAIRYWKAMTCPCATPATGQPNIVCALCRGLGWAYGSHELDDDYGRALVHNRRSHKVGDDGGYITQGYASITFRIGIIPGDGDLVQVCVDREIVNDEYHVVGALLQDGTTAETLRFRDVFCVERVMIFEPLTRRVIVPPPGSWHFDAAERRVVFLEPGMKGARYSVRYQARPEYVCQGQTAKPLMRAGHDDQLPEPYRSKTDIVYPYNVQAVRLDRAIVQRMRGAKDVGGQATTFNNGEGRGPFI